VAATGLSRPFALLAVQAAAFWPVWRWFAHRHRDARDDPAQWLLALGAVVVVVLLRGRRRNDVDDRALAVPAALTLLYALSRPFAPDLARGAIAMAALTATVSPLWLGPTFHPGLFGLSVLSLRVVPTLQFFLGYPLRVLAARCAVPLLGLTGMAARREGTVLVADGRAFVVDAPCSGIQMLWTGLFLTFALACLHGLRGRATAAALLLAVPALLVGNVTRTVLLCRFEAEPASLLHGAVGGLAYVIVAALLALATRWLARKQAPCA